jgi:ABC-type transport system involved in multi-copper enzyme maturation permease subunit
MAVPIGTLLKKDFRSWVSLRGAILLLVAAGFPALLTGAWAVTHQADAEVVSLTWEPEEVRDGDNVTLIGLVRNDGRLSTGPFNATLGLGPVGFDGRFALSTREDVQVGSLAPGATHEVRLEWTASSGLWGVAFLADPENELAELEEANNAQTRPLVVLRVAQGNASAPTAPANLTGGATATESVDAAVANLRWTPQDVRNNEPFAVEVDVRNDGPDALTNATVTIETGRTAGGRFLQQNSTSITVDLDAGASETLRFEDVHMTAGVYWMRAFVNVSSGQSDASAENNHVAVSFVVDPQPLEEIAGPDIPEGLTIKLFYVDMLILHYWIIIPFIALFFAAGVISDERSQGNLTYLLTRPIPRPVLVLSKFVTGYVYAAAAVLVAHLASFLILFGFSVERDLGFLTTPLIASLVALFAYTSIFTLFGVVFNRPYVAGVIYIFAWESLGILNRLLSLLDSDLDIAFADWVERFTVLFNLFTALGAWPPFGEGNIERVVAWPETAEASRALGILLAVAVGVLIAALVAVQRREYLQE